MLQHQRTELAQLQAEVVWQRPCATSQLVWVWGLKALMCFHTKSPSSRDLNLYFVCFQQMKYSSSKEPPCPLCSTVVTSSRNPSSWWSLVSLCWIDNFLWRKLSKFSIKLSHPGIPQTTASWWGASQLGLLPPPHLCLTFSFVSLSLIGSRNLDLMVSVSRAATAL